VVSLLGAAQTKENISKIEDSEAKLKELCSRIVPDLDNCTNKDKKDAYTYLDLKVIATPEGVDIKGHIQPKLLTTARTSGCMCSYRNIRPASGNTNIRISFLFSK